MAKVKSNKVNYYTGETRDQLRDGYGVYYYANKFFRYDGDWMKGKKHGHGKLIMADGSYYEGEFKDGEIEGHGFRKWQHTGNSYSGEFHLGEMQGYGVLNYADGSEYKGEFFRNCRHGNGVFTDKFGNVYEGTWYKNQQNGHAVLNFPSGDVYEGTFVRGRRHGHGLLRYADGGFYEGQWHADLFSGEGKMVHCSGVSYDGLWLNGKPALTAHEMKLVNNAKSIDCQHGQAFSVKLCLVDQSGNVITEESGRKFEITAGLKYTQQNKSHQSLLELIEDIEEKPIVTPFGYDVLPYPILEYEPTGVIESIPSIDSNKQSTKTLSGENSFESDCAEKINSAGTGVRDESILIKSSLTDSSFSFDDSKSWLQAPGPVRVTLNGTMEFENMFLPYIPPKAQEEVKTKKSKGSRTASAVSSASSEGKPTATSKQKIVTEKGATPGEYVLMIKEITEPPFLATRLETFYSTVTVSVPKQVRKKSKLVT